MFKKKQQIQFGAKTFGKNIWLQIKFIIDTFVAQKRNIRGDLGSPLFAHIPWHQSTTTLVTYLWLSPYSEKIIYFSFINAVV